MAIKRVDMETGEILPLSDREIKAEVQELTGWDNAKYQREYDKFRNRLRNYEKAVNRRTPRRANEEFLRIQRKIYAGEELTTQQKAITQFTTAGTKQFQERIEKGALTQKQRELAFLGLVGSKQVTPENVINFGTSEFSGLITKSKITRDSFINFLNTVVRVEKVKINGELVNKPVYRYEEITPQQVKAYLALQAKRLHIRQQRTIEANTAFYGNGSLRKPGSD